MYDCTTSGNNNVAGNCLVGLDTAKKWVMIITLTIRVDTFHVGRRHRVVEITLIQMMVEEHKVTTSMVIQVIQNEVSIQPNF